MMKIGIRDGCLQQPWPGAFAMAARVGFDGLELDLGADYEETLLWSADGRRQLHDLIASSGLELASFCAGVCWTHSPASDDVATRGRIREMLATTCAHCAEFGVQWILVPVTPGEEGVTHETGTVRWIEMMADLAPVAVSHGVTLCLENVGRGYGKSAAELAHMVDTIQSPGLKVYYDVGNAMAFANDPVAEIKFLGGRIGEVHIKERNADLLGDGVVPIPACLAALRGLGYDDWLVLETNPTEGPEAAARYNLEYLRGLLRA
jgi:L-ribulose-5-phosphate 3-epimerase